MSFACDCCLFVAVSYCRYRRLLVIVVCLLLLVIAVVVVCLLSLLLLLLLVLFAVVVCLLLSLGCYCRLFVSPRCHCSVLLLSFSIVVSVVCFLPTDGNSWFVIVVILYYCYCYRLLLLLSFIIVIVVVIIVVTNWRQLMVRPSFAGHDIKDQAVHCLRRALWLYMFSLLLAS